VDGHQVADGVQAAGDRQEANGAQVAVGVQAAGADDEVVDNDK